MKLFALTAIAAASVVMLPASAMAQSAPGPVIPGICVINLQGVLASSTAGQAMANRMRDLRQEVIGEVGPYYQSVQAGLTTLEQGAAAMTPEQRNQQSQALQQRYGEAQQLEQTRQAELSYTANQQLEALAASSRPIIAAVYAERGCGLLMNSDSIIEMNPAMDISEAVLQRVNAQVPGNGSFNRLAVPAQAQQQ